MLKLFIVAVLVLLLVVCVVMLLFFVVGGCFLGWGEGGLGVSGEMFHTYLAKVNFIAQLVLKLASYISPCIMWLSLCVMVHGPTTPGPEIAHCNLSVVLFCKRESPQNVLWQTGTGRRKQTNK